MVFGVRGGEQRVRQTAYHTYVRGRRAVLSHGRHNQGAAN